MGFFTRYARATTAKADPAALGKDAIAMRIGAGSVIPKHCVGVVFDQAGGSRRIDAGHRAVLTDMESACCFHPGPYRADLTPFEVAPEVGLRLSFVVDSADPRVTQQRFDLYLMSEAEGQIERASFQREVEGALQRELRQGNLELPPCTSLAEWNRFRAGLNELLYSRFGITVLDCIPVDLGDQVDFAQLLQARLLAAPAAPALTPASAPDIAAMMALDISVADRDARALRRLFLELPGVLCGLRLAKLAPGPAQFQVHRSLLLRLDHISLGVCTMPSLEWAAPDRPLGAAQQMRRASGSIGATRALDEAWALLARLKDAQAGQLPMLFDQADRIVANLEFELAARRLAESEPA